MGASHCVCYRDKMTEELPSQAEDLRMFFGMPIKDKDGEITQCSIDVAPEEAEVIQHLVKARRENKEESEEEAAQSEVMTMDPDEDPLDYGEEDDDDNDSETLFEDEEIKEHAEQAASKALSGLNSQVKKSVKGDDIDKKVNGVLKDLLSQVRQKLMRAIAKSMNRKQTPVDKEVDQMLGEGVLPDDFNFLKKLTMKQLEESCTGLIPIIRLDAGKYLVGSEQKSIQIKAESLLVRVGGGYITLQEHIEKLACYECLKINGLMRKHQIGFKEAVCMFLDKLKANVKVRDGFLKGDNCSVEAFEATMTVLHARQQIIGSMAKKARRSTMKKNTKNQAGSIADKLHQDELNRINLHE